MKKYIVLYLIISIMLAPIVEAGQEDYDVHQAAKGAIIAVAVIAAICVIAILSRPPRFDTQEEIDEYIKTHPEAWQRIQHDYQQGVYNTNYYDVLSWAKEGMDESAFRDKIGVSWAKRCLQSTYSSMGSTVVVYATGRVNPPDDGYQSVRVWLTFIDGKLSSISTFRD